MKTHKRMIGIILVLTLITMLPFIFHTPLLGHDELFHLSNIDVLASSLSWNIWKEGFHIIPEIANHLGYGIGIFYPILPHLLGAIIASILALFHLPTIGAIYILYFIVISLASTIIYFISLEIQENKYIALLSAIFYMTMPYVLSDLWIRFSLNEIFLLLFFPMVVLGLLKLLKGKIKSFYCLFILGYFGMITSHLVMTLYITLLLIPFAIIYRKKLWKRSTIIPCLKAIGIVTILVLPNIVLFLQHFISGGYVVFQDNIMTSLSLVQSETLNLQDYLMQTKNYDWTCAYHIPIILIIFFFFSLYTSFRDKRKYLGYFIVLFCITLFMMSPIFPWQLLPDLFYMIQFPWRLELLLLLPLVIIAPLCLNQIKMLEKKQWIYVIFILIYLSSQIPFVTKLLNRPYHLDHYTYTANDAMGHQQEYVPVEASKNWENRDQTIFVLNGLATAEITKNQLDMTFYINHIDGKVTIELPRFYYLGYTLKDEYGNHYHYKKSKDGYIEATVDQNGTYTLVYTGTTIYRLLRMIRLFYIFMMSIWIIRSIFKKISLKQIENVV